MKNKISIALVLFLLSFTIVKAQIPNGGFEDTLQNGYLKNWHASFLAIIIVIDSNGVSHSDSLSGFSFVSKSNDAHSGNQAVQIKNIYNYTQQITYPGVMNLGDDTDAYATFSQMIPLSQRPTDFSFYYKYNSVGNDSAYANVVLYDKWGNPVCDETLLLGSSNSNYAYANMPLKYFTTPNDSATIATIMFSTAKINTTNAHFGSTLLIDDVSFSKKANGVNNILNQNAFEVFPNPVLNEVNVKGINEINSIKIFNVAGNVVMNFVPSTNKIDCSKLPNGVYTIQLETKNGVATKQVVINR